MDWDVWLLVHIPWLRELLLHLLVWLLTPKVSVLLHLEMRLTPKVSVLSLLVKVHMQKEAVTLLLALFHMQKVIPHWPAGMLLTRRG